MLKKMREKVYAELAEKCEAIATHIMKYSISRKGNSTETEVFFNKMIADFYRYLAEFTIRTDMKTLTHCKDKCTKHYTRAWEVSKNGLGFKKALDPCNTTRLSTALHYGNFLNEQMGQPQQAITVCQEALKLSQDHIGELTEEAFQEVSHLNELI
jgi:14-3-3 protein epsilon